jgi:hypothetical protein
MRYLLVFFFLFPGILAKTNAGRPGRVVSGLVTTQEEKSALPGALVYVKGTQNASGTQQDGVYYIEVTPADSVLVFRYDGYQTREVRLTSACEYNVVLCKL